MHLASDQIIYRWIITDQSLKATEERNSCFECGLFKLMLRTSLSRVLFQGKVALLGCNDCFMSVTRDNEVVCESRAVGEAEIIKVCIALLYVNGKEKLCPINVLMKIYSGCLFICHYMVPSRLHVKCCFFSSGNFLFIYNRSDRQKNGFLKWRRMKRHR